MKFTAYTKDGVMIAADQLGAASPSVSISKANQATLPSLPLSRSLPRATLGDSGTRMLHGIITDDYNPDLQGVQGIRAFDMMRRSDGTVRAAIIACTLPIINAKWFINPSTDEKADTEIANFVEHALFDWLDQTFDDMIRQALLMLPFGVMVFEKVYEVREHDGKEYVTLQKLAPRLPKSILQWELPDRTFGIQQIRQDGILAMIPGSKMLIFVNEREGDNWWGTSMLRAAYKHWYHKENYYKIDGIAFERQGLGIPKITMPTSYTDDDEAKAATIAKNLRANANSYIILPPGYEAEFMDMGAKSVRDPENAINHHNKEILQSVLAQFLELGSTRSGSGSHALSSDHSDLFLKSLMAIATSVAAQFNKDLIPELVDLNFPDAKVYPVLDFAGIEKIDVAAMGTALSQLVTAGAIHPTDDDEQYIRAAMGLPPRSQEDIDAAAEEEPTMQEQEDHADIEGGTGKPTGPADVEGDANADETKKKPKPTDAKTTDTATKAKKKVVKPKKEMHEHALPRIFDDGKGFKSWRPLSFSEKKVDWQSIQDKMDTLESSFSAVAKRLLKNRKDAFMNKLHDAIASGSHEQVAALEAEFVNDYKTLLKKTMADAYGFGRANASTEMGVQTPAADASTMAGLDVLAETIANKAAHDIETKAKLMAVNALRQDKNPLQASGAIDSELDDAIDKAVDNAAGVIVSQSLNAGRNDTFEAYSDRIQSLQRSEILDDKTCNFCFSMDGLVVEKGDEWAKTDTYHDWCRGVWVEILNDEENPPAITGVPDNIASHYGGSPNALTQPKSPIVRPGSLAEKELAKLKKK